MDELRKCVWVYIIPLADPPRGEDSAFCLHSPLHTRDGLTFDSSSFFLFLLWKWENAGIVNESSVIIKREGKTSNTNKSVLLIIFNVPLPPNAAALCDILLNGKSSYSGRFARTFPPVFTETTCGNVWWTFAGEKEKSRGKKWIKGHDSFLREHYHVFTHISFLKKEGS